MIKYTNQLQSYQFNIESKKSHHKNKKGGYDITKYNNSIMTFDLEVTSAWLENGKVIGYTKGKDNEYWNTLQPLSIPYIWQFSCDGIVYYGREITDFLKVLNDIPKDVSSIIWVHNLSYEFMHLCNILEWNDVFARSPHKPMKARAKKYNNIEFRCSYMLTRLSLETWGEQVGVHKAVGDLDYETIRTPLTELTKEELNYCKQDCLVVEAGIKQYVKRYGTQFKIPLTQTGTVRQVVKDMLVADENYVKKVKRLVPTDAREYKLLQNIFAGGFTHANRLYSNQTIEGHIEHYDFASSYPTVMVAEKYPMTPWLYKAGYKKIPPEHKFDDYAYIMYLKFSQLNSTSFNTYLQRSKCGGSGIETDNGRVLKADVCYYFATEQDYITIKNNYEWKELEVLNVWESKKEYLPKPFVEYILQLYANKTELKDVEGKEELYMQSKQYINSMYGMSVTAIVQANVELHNGVWSVQPLTEDYVNDRLERLKNRNKYERRYFLSYSWGCWVTAYSRRNLWKCIEGNTKDGQSNDMQVLYCDTDSIFILGNCDFSWYNKEITEKLKKACEAQGLDFNKTRPKTPKGKEKPLGIFDREEDCIQFRTLGAKRYVERRKDGKLYLTVSGINKDAVELLNDDINNFTDGFNFDKDADCVKKRLCTYISDMPSVTYPDGYKSKIKYGINLRRTGYLLTMANEYKDLLELMEDFNFANFDEHVINSMRGRFSMKGEMF